MKRLLLVLSILLITNFAFSQNTPYVIYNAKGKKVSYKKMLKTLAKTDIVLFGEQHNSAITHWLQYEVTQDLSTKRNIILGAEMFEADNQIQLNDYLKGTIK